MTTLNIIYMVMGGIWIVAITIMAVALLLDEEDEVEMEDE